MGDIDAYIGAEKDEFKDSLRPLDYLMKHNRSCGLLIVMNVCLMTYPECSRHGWRNGPYSKEGRLPRKALAFACDEEGSISPRSHSYAADCVTTHIIG